MTTAVSNRTRTELQEVGVRWADADDILRLTFTNLHTKLSHLGLWNHVAQERDSSRGCFHFEVADIEAFRRSLTSHRAMTAPSAPNLDGYWESRERIPRGSLHIKHFDGWPAHKVQAHIDPWGIHMRSRWWWLCPPVPLGLLVLHALDPDGYLDVERCLRQIGRSRATPR